MWKKCISVGACFSHQWVRQWKHKSPTHQWEKKSCSDEYMKDFPPNSGDYTVTVAASNFVITLLSYSCGTWYIHWDLSLSSLDYTFHLHNVPKKTYNGTDWNFNWNKSWGKCRSRNLPKIYCITGKVNMKSQNVHFQVLESCYFQTPIKKSWILSPLLKVFFKT